MFLKRLYQCFYKDYSNVFTKIIAMFLLFILNVKILKRSIIKIFYI